MPQASIFRWRDGEGWLVLSGGGDYRAGETLDVDAEILSRTISHNPLAYIWAAGDVDEADSYLDYLNERGGRTGYLVDIITEDDDSIRRQLTEAGIIILGDGANVDRLRRGLAGAPIAAIQEAYENGATICGQGRAAGLLARWFSHEAAPLQNGLDWLHDSVAFSGYTGAQSSQLQALLKETDALYGIGLGAGGALALNPEGAVETWGENVSILLNSRLHADS